MRNHAVLHILKERKETTHQLRTSVEMDGLAVVIVKYVKCNVLNTDFPESDEMGMDMSFVR